MHVFEEAGSQTSICVGGVSTRTGSDLETAEHRRETALSIAIGAWRILRDAWCRRIPRIHCLLPNSGTSPLVRRHWRRARRPGLTSPRAHCSRKPNREVPSEYGSLRSELCRARLRLVAEVHEFVNAKLIYFGSVYTFRPSGSARSCMCVTRFADAVAPSDIRRQSSLRATGDWGRLTPPPRFHRRWGPLNFFHPHASYIMKPVEVPIDVILWLRFRRAKVRVLYRRRRRNCGRQLH